MLFILLVASVCAIDTVVYLQDLSFYQSLVDYVNATNGTLIPLDVYTPGGSHFYQIFYPPVGIFQPMMAMGYSVYPFLVEATIPFVNHEAVSDQPYLEDIFTEEAWARHGRGSPDQVIAVVDSGRWANNPDLVNFYRGEDLPEDGIDDDGNGFIDDSFGGWNVVDDTNDPSDPGISRRDDRLFSHGSAVWITAAAPKNNAGLIGVAPRVKGLMVRAGHIDRNAVYFTIPRLVAAQDYIRALKQNGVDIRVQVASYGGYAYSIVLEKAIRKTLAEGILMVASAGNDNNNNDVNPTYPCCFDIPGIICVGATQGTSKASYSNYGDAVDLSAPGSVTAPVVVQGSRAIEYTEVTGTSFSAPLVAGVAMMIFGADPALTPIQVKQCIVNHGTETSSDLKTRTNVILSALSAGDACLAAVPEPSPPPRAPAPSPRPNGAGLILSAGLILLVL